MLELRYVLIAVSCILISVITLLILKYKKLLRRKETKMSKEEVLGRLFLRKLKKISESSSKEEPRELFKRLNNIMRNFFSELFDIAYEFAYVELNEELAKKDIDEDIRHDIINYTMQMAETEYSGHKISTQEFYYMLGKSIRIISKVTGHKEEKVEEVEKKPPEKEPVKEAEKAPAKPPEEKEIKKAAPVPKKEEENVSKLRSLLVVAEGYIKENKSEAAMESYTQLREIYDSLGPEVKRKIYPETKRIIVLYNSLLKEYKDVLTGKK